MADNVAAAVVDDDDDFELITSARQLGTPPPLRKEEVKIRDWPTADGKKKAKFLAWEMTGGDYREYVESGWTYKDGMRQKYDNAGEEMRFLSFGIRDQHGTRIWPTVDAAKAQLEALGRPSLLLLLNAVNKANSVKPAGAEGNSEGTPTDS